MTEIYLIRHGETDWNIIKRYQGVTDIPLNLTGHEQARKAAQKIGALEKKFTAIYSSPQKRAYQTAQAISEKLGLPIYQDERLREINLGDWEGMLSTEVKQVYSDLNQKWHRNPFTVSPPGVHGESAMQVVERVIEVLDDIAERYPQDTVLVSTHGFTMAAAVGLVMRDLDHLLEYLPGNAEFIRIEWTAKCCLPDNTVVEMKP